MERPFPEGLWWHVTEGAWTGGGRGHARVDLFQPGHAKVCHLGPAVSQQQDVVAGEVSVLDVVGVEVSQGSGHIQTQVQLQVKWQGLRGAVQEVSEAAIHELHEQDRQSSVWVCVCAQVLHNVGVLDGSQQLTLLLEPVEHAPDSRVSKVKEEGVDDLGSTGEGVTLCLADRAIGASAQGLVLEQGHLGEAKLRLGSAHAHTNFQVHTKGHMPNSLLGGGDIANHYS